MSDSYETDGVMVQGRNGLTPKPVSPVAFAQGMRRFEEGQRVVISVKLLRARRSNQQNRFWHGVVIPLFQDHFNQGRADVEKFAFDDVKDILARKLLPLVERIDPTTGEVFQVLGHTSDLNTKEFNELIERAQVWGAEIGLYVPDPNEMGFAA